MTVRQVIDLAKTSELNGLGVASKDDVVLGFINLGVLELYKRFTLRNEEYIIELVDGVDIYTMPANYMWAVAAYGEVDIRSTEIVNQLPINEEDNPLSVNSVGWNKLQVPVSVGGAHISIIYVASPEVYTIDNLDAEIDLPPQMIETLLAYVGYKGNSTVDSGVQTEDNAWYMRFEASCGKLREYAMVTSDDMYMSKRLSMRGFV
jgi:hypothetical protein